MKTVNKRKNGLTNVTLSYAIKIANKGLKKASVEDGIYQVINTVAGYLTYKAVADAHGLEYSKASKLFNQKKRLIYSKD